jgi:hypothetical protein
MVRVKGGDGGYFHEPPYTEDEESDFYRRVGNGPVTVLHAPKTEKPKPPKPRPPAK